MVSWGQRSTLFKQAFWLAELCLWCCCPSVELCWTVGHLQATKVHSAALNVRISLSHSQTHTNRLVYCVQTVHSDQMTHRPLSAWKWTCSALSYTHAHTSCPLCSCQDLGFYFPLWSLGFVVCFSLITSWLEISWLISWLIVQQELAGRWKSTAMCFVLHHIRNFFESWSLVRRPSLFHCKTKMAEMKAPLKRSWTIWMSPWWLAAVWW